MSFVTKAILWDRGICQHTPQKNHPHHGPTLCPRFLAHMKSHPEDLRPPCVLSSSSRPQPPCQGRMPTTHTLTAPKTHTLEGSLPLSSGSRRTHVQNPVVGRRSAVIVPCPPLRPPPTSSTINPTPPHQISPPPELSNPDSVTASPAAPSPAPENKDDFMEKERAAHPTVVSISSESDWKLHPVSAAGPDRSTSPASTLSHGSLSDLSRPPSSLFSRSTNLSSGRSSVVSDIHRLDSEGSIRLSSFHSGRGMLSPSVSNPHQSPTNTTTSSQLLKQQFGPNKPISPTSVLLPQRDKPLSGRESPKASENLNRDTPADPPLNQHSDSDPGLIPLTFHSATWSSCPSPSGTTPPRSGTGRNVSPPVSVTGLESHRWPVLPPISPVRGRCGTTASGYSELSCSQSHVFDELEAIAPRSDSCQSLDRPLDSSGCHSPDSEVSPGLAALTVGCDSGNLGAISRVQLLLLDRHEPETTPSPFDYEEELLPVEDWSDLSLNDDPELTSAGVSRPLTAGSNSERCDSAGEVQENKSDESEEDFGSPSSWIIDQSPSYKMFTSSPCKSNHGSSAVEGSILEESNHSGWRDPTVGRRSSSGQKDMELEERKTKALNMLFKLQGDTPCQTKRSKSRSNFEEFDFLAKYCIFSQEKLAEYKRAFQAEDSDGDGYISCLQVLLALKNILPAELLSDEEEIYVYRILEMVDFRVTDGLVDLRLFAVIASLAQKVATMDEFMRSLIINMDFRSLEVRLFKAKQLFLFLLEEQRGGTGAQPGFISAEQLMLELKAGGIELEQEAAVRLELQRVPPLDLLDFLAYLPLFMLIHKSVISNPLDSSSNL